METEEHDRGARRVGVLLALAAVASVAASLAVGARLPSGLRMVWWHPEILVALAWTPVGAVLLRHRPGLKVAWLMVGSGFSASVYVLALNLGPWFELHGWPATGFVQWLATWLWAVDTYALTLILPLIFPDGRLVSRWFRPVLVLACLVPVIVCVHLTIDPDVRRWHNGVSVYPFDRIPLAISAIILLSLAAGLFSVAVRFVQSPPDVRRQIGWVVYPGLVAEAIIFAGENSPIGDPLRNITIVAVPICIAIAITRYRLYDIDLVVSRTLVYAGLVVVITGVYFALVGTASLLAHGRGTLAGLAGAIVAGAVFEPVRRRLQRTVDGFIHGERDPYRIADRLNRRLQTAADPGAALAVAAEVARSALHATGVALEVLDRDGRTISAEDGVLGERPQLIPLVWHGEPVGRLLFGVTRTPDARLSGVLARNLAELANAARLAADVQRSREHILRTREEERRRLRRDLHDGLGPTLASLAMTVDAARITLKTDPEAADELLEELRATMGHTIGDIRELVYGLRPPALDDLGLEGAIQALGGVVATGDGPQVDVHVEGDLKRLPAAAEVAAYRIVQEALTNVHRHANAGCAEVRLYLNGDLHVTVGDDGVGLPAQVRSGIGMSSMRERAAELGGSCTVGPGPRGGTLVRARLPVNGVHP
ncbi:MULTISPECIES: sensor histidine kinase [Actinomadura]|uniref:Histidine kinase-, DNA gyrase B-, and HSP90-like ATPase n=1 Tax=Actinomadura madurae TaxID=1993 RepID=A0A1I4WIK9_9ACTN|nr:sensor histidine kinase [Actinomadura madurae]SFN13255.1 Histidine kinase-, DNA gyrase B-, and HSP90-like ATPase [Actinomadura madurae]SPT63121.1 Oxygen sensor histidine kinase nreB [Actinomadura madurae]